MLSSTFPREGSRKEKETDVGKKKKRNKKKKIVAFIPAPITKLNVVESTRRTAPPPASLTKFQGQFTHELSDLICGSVTETKFNEKVLRDICV